MKHFTLIFLLCCAAVAKGVREEDDEATSGSSNTVNCCFQDENDVKFHLHNHHASNNPHKLKFNSTINSKWVNFEWKTIVFIRGSTVKQLLTNVIKKAILDEANQRVNFIEVNWLRSDKNPLYCPSAKSVPNVGETVAKFIGLMVSQKKFNLERLVIVGHSLGAHAAGLAGKSLQLTYKIKPRLIVGLDPAGPFFRGNNPKLHKNDAKDVLVIHTSQIFGHLEPLGNIDIYINGGKIQPYCNDAQSHCFAELIYKEFINGANPLIGHRYLSFAEVSNDVVPAGEGIQLFQAAPLPPPGTLLYVSTMNRPHLNEEVKKYMDPELHPDNSDCCAIM